MNVPSSAPRSNIPDMPSVDDLLPYLRQIDENRWYSNFGPLAQTFETRFAQRMEKAHKLPDKTLSCVGLASGYQALTIGLRLLGVVPNDKVLIPSVTFPACPLAAAPLGAEAILSDVDPQTWTLTPEIARQAASKMKLAAVMPVCVYGFPLPAEEWDAFSRETGVKVIIDAAAAVEAQKYPETCLVAHSLHALKPFGIGEGGLLVARDPDLIQQARERINFGMKDHITYQTGENAKMSEYHAAVGLAQLTRWEDIKKRRQKIYETYKLFFESLQDLTSIHPLLEKTIASSLMISLKEGNALEVFNRLQQQNVAVHHTYLPPLYEHPAFAGLEVTGKEGANEIKHKALGLPFHAFLSDEEIGKIVQKLRESL